MPTIITTLCLVIALSLGLSITPVFAKDKLTKGSRWIATGKITVKPRKATLYFQDGKQMDAPMSGDKYYPWCAIESKQKAKEQIVIEKGTFEITGISYLKDPISDTTTSFKTIMDVKSEQHPQIHIFTCGNWDDSIGDFVTIEQMRTVMKGLFTLELKPN
jgi:hypothetical protein